MLSRLPSKFPVPRLLSPPSHHDLLLQFIFLTPLDISSVVDFKEHPELRSLVKVWRLPDPDPSAAGTGAGAGGTASSSSAGAGAGASTGGSSKGRGRGAARPRAAAAAAKGVGSDDGGTDGSDD